MAALRPALAVLIAVLFSLQAAGAEPDRNYNITGILDSLLTNYDKRLRPNYGGQPVEVSASMHVINVASLSEMNMEYTIEIYLRLYWRDQRLSYDKKPGLETIALGPGLGEHIWVPDTFIVNEKRSQGSSKFSSDEFLRINPSGDVVRSVRISATASCPMSLQYFPMDQQICALSFESYGHSMKDLRFKWKDGADSVSVGSSILLPQFKMIGFRQKIVEISLTSANYSMLSCEFQFVRYIGYYVMQIYIPAALIVIISWATFWLDRGTAKTTRVALGAIAVLTMTALLSSTNITLPQVSYIKATDIYLGVCFVMVSAALIEYAIVCYMLKRLKDIKVRLLIIQQIVDEQGKTGGGVTKGTKANEVKFEVTKGTATTGTANGHADEESGALVPSGGKEEKLYGVVPSALDKYSRILFPVAFVCFNLIYWVIYLHIGGTPAKDMILL